jgi:hypothetical protein
VHTVFNATQLTFSAKSLCIVTSSASESTDPEHHQFQRVLIQNQKQQGSDPENQRFEKFTVSKHETLTGI